MVTQKRLLAIALLSCLVSAVFGAEPLAAWVDASVAAGTVVQTATHAWLEAMRRIGLDRPYSVLRAAIRAAERD